ncbi:MAG: pyridoxamine 5'-phosphate oxidase family protein [Streptosporangiales bacterium]|nr:pyridoxamine 5'-phosphate oxidase family protein [Streptosporangiales bacterium]
MPERVIEEMDSEECLRLVSPGGVGRIAYGTGGGLAIRPVNYRIIDGSVVFRTAEHGALDQDLRTGIEGAEYRVAFEIDDLDPERQQGWSVLMQGPAHHLTGAERDAYRDAGLVTWAGGEREMYVRITPSRITGRRVRQA